jgi:DNA replication protein DnaC
MIGEDRIVDAIVDRVLRNSEIVISGDSMRLKKSFRKKKEPVA